MSAVSKNVNRYKQSQQTMSVGSRRRGQDLADRGKKSIDSHASVIYWTRSFVCVRSEDWVYSKLKVVVAV